MKKAWIVLQKSIMIFLVVTLLINVYLIAAQVFFKNDLPKVAGYAQIIVISGSMQPSLMVGDFLIIHERENYEPQDIVTYRSNGKLITHRIIEIENGQAIIKGDANNVVDEPVSMENIEGKVMLRIPRIGNFILFLKTSQGVLLLILVLSVIYILFELPSLIKSRKTSEEKQDHRR